MVAMYLKQHKPGSKVIILDANPDIVSKKGLFLKGWKKHYDGLIDYRAAKKVTEVDTGKMAVMIEGLEEVQGAVINIIPPQKAGLIAHAAVWSVRTRSGARSIRRPSSPPPQGHPCHRRFLDRRAMPKSGTRPTRKPRSAHQYRALMNGKEVTEMSAINTCYSFLAAKEAVSVTGVYKVNAEKQAIEA